VELLHPSRRTRYWVGVVGEADQRDETLRTVVEVVEFLKALVSAGAQPATPWGTATERGHGAVEQRDAGIEALAETRMPGVVESYRGPVHGQYVTVSVM
jgi:hypothetical protein